MSLKASPNLIDLTPLVDVIFLLLIFFILTSDILPFKSLNISNPSLPYDSLPMTSQVVVMMDAQNVIYVGSKKNIVDLGSLKEHLKLDIAKLQDRFPGAAPSIVLSLDKRVDYGSFLRLFSVCQECGSSMRLVHKTEEL